MPASRPSTEHFEQTRARKGGDRPYRPNIVRVAASRLPLAPEEQAVIEDENELALDQSETALFKAINGKAPRACSKTLQTERWLSSRVARLSSKAALGEASPGATNSVIFALCGTMVSPSSNITGTLP